MRLWFVNWGRNRLYGRVIFYFTDEDFSLFPVVLRHILSYHPVKFAEGLVLFSSYFVIVLFLSCLGLNRLG